MKYFSSLKLRFLLISGFSVFLWIIFSLYYVDRFNYIKNIENHNNDFIRIQSELNKLSLEAEKLIFKCREIQAGTINNSDNHLIEQLCYSLIQSAGPVTSDIYIAENHSIRNKINLLSEKIRDIKKSADECDSLLRVRGDMGQGLLYEWYTHFRKIGSLTYNHEFFRSLNQHCTLFLFTFDPGFLEKLIDDWKIFKYEILADRALSGTSKIYVSDFMAYTEQLLMIQSQFGSSSDKGVQGNLRFKILEAKNISENISSELSSLSADSFRSLSDQLIWMIILICLLIMLMFYILFVKNIQPLNQLTEFLLNLKSGEMPEKINISRGAEINRLKENINNYIDDLKEKINFVNKIGEGTDIHDFKSPGEKDILGNSLLKLAQRITKAREVDEACKTDNQKTQWINEGIALLGEVSRSERDNLNELAFRIIKTLVKYIGAIQGSIYLNNTENDISFMEVVATFANDRRKYLNKKFLPGEGLIGTCALEKEALYLTEIPNDYPEITCGIGKLTPRSILVVPFKHEIEIFGVIELASLNFLKEHEISFVEQLGDSISNIMSAVRTNEKTSLLLVQSQKQAEKMVLQEEKILNSLQELENAHAEYRKKENEIKAIFSAVNSSSLFAEFTINGRFSDINENFLLLLNAHRDQITGKHHSDFAVVDKYSDEYKEFWKNLREGNTVAKMEHFRLINGKEIWLKATFVPVKNEEGITYKTYFLGYDITEEKPG